MDFLNPLVQVVPMSVIFPYSSAGTPQALLKHPQEMIKFGAMFDSVNWAYQDSMLSQMGFGVKWRS
ncbi:hypothetical protein LXL04_027754 [Taraxacum kok-saghyz]